MKKATSDKIKILIVADGSKEIGLGHIVRTLTLANELKNYYTDILFITKKNESSISLIKDEDYPLILLNEKLNEKEELEEIVKIINTKKMDIVILDKLTISKEYYDNIKLQNTFLVSLDNIRDISINADLIINGGIYANEYFNTKQKNVLLGEKYFILRRQFIGHKKRIINENITNILISMGGSDPLNITYSIVQELLKIKKEYLLNVIIGNAYLHESKLIELSMRNKNLNLIKNTDQMARLMKNSDVAITSGGLTLYELAATGTPAMIIQQADNQILPTKYFEKYGSVIDLGNGRCLNKERMLDKLSYLDRNKNIRLKMAEEGMTLIDGFGAIRSAEAIMNRYLMSIE